MSAASEILSQVDWSAVVAIGGLVAGWLWKKKKGEKTITVREMLEDVVTAVINAADVDPENVKSRAEAELRSVLAKVGIKGASAELMVHEFVVYAAAELAKRWAVFTRDLDLLAANAAAAAKAGA